MSDFAIGAIVGAIAATLVGRLVQSLLATVLPVAVIAGVAVLVAGPDRSSVLAAAIPVLERLTGGLMEWTGGRAGQLLDLARTLLKL